MKTNFKTGVLALALIASVTSVFASDIANAVSGKKLLDYTWTTYDREENVTGTNIPGDQNDFSECNGNTTLCAVGTSPDGPTITRRYLAE